MFFEILFCANDVTIARGLSVSCSYRSIDRRGCSRVKID